jgi:hypothetical protein
MATTTNPFPDVALPAGGGLYGNRIGLVRV